MRKLDYLPDAPPAAGLGFWYMAKAWPTMYGYTHPRPWSKGWGTFTLFSGTHAGNWESYGHYSFTSPDDNFTHWFLCGVDGSRMRMYRIVNQAAAPTQYLLHDHSLAGGWTYQLVSGNKRGFDVTSWGSNCYCTSDAVTTTTGVFVSTGFAAFTQIASSPNAHTIECFKDFLIVGNINNTFGGGIVGTQKMIAWSDQGNPNVWTPASGVQANWAELRDSPGRIVAIRRLGDACIVYMEDAIYSMTYIGGAYTWRFEKIVDGIGADDDGHQVSVLNTGNFHVFTHRGRAYVFDGSRPRPISQSRVEGQMGIDWAYYGSWGKLGVSMIHHQRQQIVEFGPDALIYHYGADRWAMAGNNMTAGLSSIIPASLGGHSLSPTHRNWRPLTATHSSSWAGISLDTWPTPYPEIIFGNGSSGGTTIEASWRGLIQVGQGSRLLSSAEFYMFPVGNYAKTQHLRNAFIEFGNEIQSVDPWAITGTLLVNPIPSKGGNKEGSYTLQAWNAKRMRFEIDKTGHFFQLRFLIEPGINDEFLYFSAPRGAEVTDVIFDFLPAGRD